MKIWIKALLVTILIIGIIHALAYIATGFWTLGIDLRSRSMEPNMHIGDLILVQSAQHTNITTYEEGMGCGGGKGWGTFYWISGLWCNLNLYPDSAIF